MHLAAYMLILGKKAETMQEALAMAEATITDGSAKKTGGAIAPRAVMSLYPRSCAFAESQNYKTIYRREKWSKDCGRKGSRGKLVNWALVVRKKDEKSTLALESWSSKNW